MVGNTKLVVDASVILSDVMSDEVSVFAKELDQHVENKILMMAPFILEYEIANALKSACRSRRLSKELMEKIYINFLNIKIEFVETNMLKAMSLAIENDLSVYDACYLELALRFRYRLLTLDKKLLKIYIKLTDKI